jgi:hypothetical protein
MVLILGITAGSGSTPTASAHYIYYCPGYVWDNVPANCHADPFAQPSTHQWAAGQATNILAADGWSRYANLLRSKILIGRSGVGRTHLSLLIEGIIRADTDLNGCKQYGRDIGWPLGDHMTNPYRAFGVWSYNVYENATEHPGWQGYNYVVSNGRRTGECASAPRVRSTSAAMADEFFARAKQAWHDHQPGDAMYNLGIAVHVVQDATVPSHVHPESNIFRTGHDAFPAWASEMHIWYPVNSGGLYTLPQSSNGVTVAKSPGGWVYWMASLSYPYFPYISRLSALPKQNYGCDATERPEECLAESTYLLGLTQRASAGFIRYFFFSVGYPP